MAWALQFDGVNDFADIQNTVVLVGFYEVILNYESIDSYAKLADSPTVIDRWDINVTSATGLLAARSYAQFEVDGVPNGVIPLGQPTVIRVFRDGSDADQANKEFGKIFARFDNTSQAGGKLKSITVNNGIGGIDYFFDVTASVTGGVPPLGSPTVIDTISGNIATGVNMPTDGSAWVDLGGGGLIDVTLAAAGYNCNGNNLNVDVTSEVQIALNTASYTYSSNNLDVVITPEIKIDLGQGGYTVTAQGLDVTPTIDISLEQGNYNLTGDGLLVDVGANISIPLSQEGYSISGDGLSVSVAGEVNIPLSATNYTYNANKLIITIGEPTEIGAVTASFKENPVSVNFSINNVTVKFRG